MTPLEVLEVRFECMDLDREVTIREWFVELLESLWGEGEAFSAKRPFGNSGWAKDPASALIRAGAISGTLDEDGYAESLDEAAYDDLMRSAILAMLDMEAPESE